MISLDTTSCIYLSIFVEKHHLLNEVTMKGCSEFHWWEVMLVWRNGIGVDMFMVLSVKYETLFLLLLFSCFMSLPLRIFYLFSSILPPTIFLKHSHDHVICLLTKPESSLLSREQRTTS